MSTMPNGVPRKLVVEEIKTPFMPIPKTDLTKDNVEIELCDSFCNRSFLLPQCLMIYY